MVSDIATNSAVIIRPPPVYIANALETVVDSIPVAVLAVDRELRLRYANARAEQFFAPDSLRREEAIPDPSFDRGFLDFVKSLIDAPGEPVRRVVETPNATYVVLGVPPRGNHVIAVYIDDITAQARQDRAQREFVANAAHELLTPLTGIASAAHALESGAKDVPELRDRFVGHISRECSRLTRLARGLLVLARAQAALAAVQAEAIELGPLIADVVDGIAAQDVRIDCPDDLIVSADRDLAEAALTNLIANSVRHSTDGKVLIVAKPDGERVDLVIENAGPVEPTDTTHVRKRFVSGDDGSTLGYGLGISIATEALGVMGATVIFDFAGNRTRAHVDFPAEGA